LRRLWYSRSEAGQSAGNHLLCAACGDAARRGGSRTLATDSSFCIHAFPRTLATDARDPNSSGGSRTVATDRSARIHALRGTLAANARDPSRGGRSRTLATSYAANSAGV
jgi:hypothetical protein